MRRSLILSVALGLTLSGCALREQSGPGQVRAAWRHHFNARNTAAVLDLYAEDATLVTEAGTFRGRDEIRKWIQVSLDQGSSLEAIEADQEKSSGTLAYGTGRSRRLVGQEVHLGRYLIVLEKTGVGWKIVQHFSLNVK